MAAWVPAVIILPVFIFIFGLSLLIRWKDRRRARPFYEAEIRQNDKAIDMNEPRNNVPSLTYAYPKVELDRQDEQAPPYDGGLGLVPTRLSIPRPTRALLRPVAALDRHGSGTSVASKAGSIPPGQSAA